MAFLSGVKQHSVEEGLAFQYWITILSLLKLGIPYDVILELTQGELELVMGITSAIKQRENDEIERQQRANNLRNSR